MSDNQPVNINNPTPSTKREVNERGFAVYGERRDSYGTRMRVQQSSNAGTDAVWLFADDNPEIPMNNGALHLNIEDARWLRERLGEWLDDAGDGR